MIEFTWSGKDAARAEADTPAQGQLGLGTRARRWTAADAPHFLIGGENLQVLKLIEPRLRGRVKMIYADPPYDTGKFFDEAGATSSARRGRGKSRDQKHADWLNMMYPRLAVARRLLRPDGAIFISIDERQYAHLVLLMNEIFGERNQIATIVWENSRKNDAKWIDRRHEYVVVYAKDRDRLAELGVRWRQRKVGLDEVYAEVTRLRTELGDDHQAISRKLSAWFRTLPRSHPSRQHARSCRVDARGNYYGDNISWHGGGGPTYDVPHPKTGRPCKVPSRGWVFATREEMRRKIAEDRVVFGRNERTVPKIKRYLHETETEPLSSVIHRSGAVASKRLKKMFGGKVFDHPKDHTVLAQLVKAVTGPGDIVLDFFAGSGSLGAAVLLANREDDQRRRFILIQQPTPTGWPSFPTRVDLVRERLRREMLGDRAEQIIKLRWRPGRQTRRAL